MIYNKCEMELDDIGSMIINNWFSLSYLDDIGSMINNWISLSYFNVFIKLKVLFY